MTNFGVLYIRVKRLDLRLRKKNHSFLHSSTFIMCHTWYSYHLILFAYFFSSSSSINRFCLLNDLIHPFLLQWRPTSSQSQLPSSPQQLSLKTSTSIMRKKILTLPLKTICNFLDLYRPRLLKIRIHMYITQCAHE